MLAGLLPIGKHELTNIGILLAFVVVCAAIIVLHTPAGAAAQLQGARAARGPMIGIVFSLWLVTFLSPHTWLRFAVVPHRFGRLLRLQLPALQTARADRSD